ncbi:MAG TPA: RHS repeat protein, partial [Planctomycetaceae bacterium]|nr:RHS repeat protein [Planctomycetaceae bacterium]
MEPDGQGGFRVTMSSGLVRSYAMVPGESNYWLVREADPAGNALDLSYRDGYLEKIQATDGAWVQFFRPLWGESAPSGTPAPRIVRILDSIGRELNLSYDSAGRLTGFVGADGASWTFGWAAENHVVDVIAPDQSVVFHVLTDADDRATSVRQGDLETAYNYGTDTTQVTGPGGGTWSYAYDADGMSLSMTDPTGGVWAIERDAATGDVVRLTDPEGGQHDFAHDGQHRLSSYTAPLVDGVRAQWLFERNAEGRLTRLTTPCGASTELGYDVSGWLAFEATDPDGDGSAEAVTTYERDPVTGDITARVDAEGRRTEYVYNAAGQIAEVHPPCRSTGPPATCGVIRLSHDAAGRLTGLDWPVGDGQWSSWTLGYDSAGHLSMLSDPFGSNWSLETSVLGEVTQITSPDGGTMEFYYGPSNRLERRVDAMGRVRQWRYDAAGRVAEYEDEVGAIWSLGYDAAGRLVSRIDPEGRQWEWAYDLAGRVRRQILPGAQEISLIRDAAGRMTRRDLPGGSSEHFVWDAEGNLEMMWSADASGVEVDRWTYTWDGRGLPTSVAQDSDLDGTNRMQRSASWQWDLSGRLVGWTDADGLEYTVKLDPWGEPGRVLQNGADVAQILRDSWSGWVTARHHYSESLYATLTRDAAGRVLTLHETENSLTLRDMEVVRDTAGRIVEVLDHLEDPAAVTTVERDLLGRITALRYADGTEEEYGYDDAGRMVRAARLDEVGVWHYVDLVRDRSGRPLSMLEENGSTSFDWDFAPAEADLGFVVRRVETSSDGQTATLAFDVDGRITRVETETDAGTVLRRRFRWMPGGLPRTVAEQRWDASGASEDDARLFLDMMGPWSEHPGDSGVASSWKLPPLFLVDRADRGQWRRVLVGRADRLRDEVRLLDGLLGADGSRVMEIFGGQMLGSGLSLPTADSFDPAPRTDEIRTTAGTRVSVHDPDPGFLDDELGLPPFSASVPRPGWSSALARVQGGVDILCGLEDYAEDRPQQCGRFWFPPPRKIWRCRSSSVEDCSTQCAGMRECPLEGGGGVGMCSGPGAHATPPIRNADRHPLGVTLSNGEFLLDVVDLSIPGRGLDLALSRSYRNQNRTSQRLGRNWSLGILDERLMRSVCDGRPVVWHRSDGSKASYDWPVNLDQAVDGPLGKLLKYRVGDASVSKEYYELRLPGGEVRTFKHMTNSPDGPYGYPVRVTRPGGSAIEFEWDSVDEGKDGCATDWAPLKATLWSCDDSARTNVRASQCIPRELGRFEFVTERKCSGFIVTEVRVIQP